jgi:conjugative relaxase-like TrwC/TraI family protein
VVATIKPVGKVDYYEQTAQLEYYQPEKSGEPPGRWHDSRATRELGLSGVARKKDVDSLAQGFHPRTGEKLVQNAGKKNRKPGDDMTVSAPKSVSIEWGGLLPPG